MAPETAATCAFSTATFNGTSAVSGLGSQIVTRRTARPGVSPIVELHSAPYKTRFGTQMKPVFKIAGWVGGSAATETRATAAPKLIPARAEARGAVYGRVDKT